jgi:hypothetical protein
MRYFIQPPDNETTLAWLLKHDAEPSVVPVFPDAESGNGLVVSYLLNGTCYAEVLTSKEHLFAVCGKGFPYGKLFFHVKNSSISSACVELSEESSEGPP